MASSLSREEIRKVSICQYIGIPLGTLVFLPFRMGIAVYILRIQGNTAKRRRLFLYTNMALFLFVTLITVVVQLVQCNPINAYWDAGLLHPGTDLCLARRGLRHLSIVFGTISAYIDLLLVVYPISLFWGLQIGLHKRVTLCALFGMGIM